MKFQRLLVVLFVAGFAATTLAEGLTLKDRRVEMDGKPEVKYRVPDGHVITGVGVRASEDRESEGDGLISTFWVFTRELLADGTFGATSAAHMGPEPHTWPEGVVFLPEGMVAVGIGVRGRIFWDIDTLSLWGASFHRDGTLGTPIEFRGGFDPEAETQRQILLRNDRLLTGFGVELGHHHIEDLYVESGTYSVYDAPERTGLYLDNYGLEPSSRLDFTNIAPEDHVVTGMFLRAGETGITTLKMYIRELHPDGTFGPEIWAHGGFTPFWEPEAEMRIPEGHVCVGYGLRVDMVGDVTQLRMWSRELNPDGTLGEEVSEHITGMRLDPSQPLQQEIRLPEGRVLTGVGVMSSMDDVQAIMATSAEIKNARKE